MPIIYIYVPFHCCVLDRLIPEHFNVSIRIINTNDKQTTIICRIPSDIGYIECTYFLYKTIELLFFQSIYRNVFIINKPKQFNFFNILLWLPQIIGIRSVLTSRK